MARPDYVNVKLSRKLWERVVARAELVRPRTTAQGLAEHLIEIGLARLPRPEVLEPQGGDGVCGVCGAPVDDREGWTHCAGGGPECGDRCPDCGPHKHEVEE